jgi:hypothetical protein
MPSTLSPSTQLDVARLCSVAGGQVILVTQELSGEAAAMLDGIQLMPIVPDNLVWRKL